MTMPRFSLVVPAYNEEALLPRLFDTIDVARGRYHGGAAEIEVIVADNASIDATATIAGQRGASIVRVERRIIAAVRNGGAAAASGEIICFVDADNRIHPDTFNAIDEVMRTGRVIGGATSARPERWSVGILVSWLMIASVALLTGIDTGVTFCRREDFLAVGGYDEGRLMAEDVQLLIELKRLGRTRGQRLVRVPSVKIIFSMRKFDRWGDWHYFTLFGRLVPVMFQTAWRLLTGRGMPEGVDRFDALALKYWYDR